MVNLNEPALTVDAGGTVVEKIRLIPVFHCRIDDRSDAVLIQFDDLEIASAVDVLRSIGTVDEAHDMVIVKRCPMGLVEPPQTAFADDDWAVEVFQPLDHLAGNFNIGADFEVKSRRAISIGLLDEALGILNRHKYRVRAKLAKRIVQVGLSAKRVWHRHDKGRQATFRIFASQPPRLFSLVR